MSVNGLSQIGSYFCCSRKRCTSLDVGFFTDSGSTDSMAPNEGENSLLSSDIECARGFNGLSRRLARKLQPMRDPFFESCRINVHIITCSSRDGLGFEATEVHVQLSRHHQIV